MLALLSLHVDLSACSVVLLVHITNRSGECQLAKLSSLGPSLGVAVVELWLVCFSFVPLNFEAFLFAYSQLC